MMSFKNKKILVIVAHPDDEVLGCGATMHNLIKNHNCTIRAVILGEGITSRSQTRDPEKDSEELENHQKNIDEAGKCIGYSSIGVHQFPDNRFDTVALLDLVKVIEKEKESFSPDIIFTHHGGDLNIDHRRTFEAVMTACRPLEDEDVSSIIAFEIPSSTEWQASTDPRHFIPNMYLEISEEHMNAKIEAMECYQYEKREFPHPRSPGALRILAQRWGVAVGKSYVEAFMIIRHIIDSQTEI